MHRSLLSVREATRRTSAIAHWRVVPNRRNARPVSGRPTTRAPHFHMEFGGDVPEQSGARRREEVWTSMFAAGADSGQAG